MYLMKYGYMDMAGGSGKSAPLLSRDGLRNYIREFQVGSWLNRSVTEKKQKKTSKQIQRLMMTKPSI